MPSRFSSQNISFVSKLRQMSTDPTVLPFSFTLMTPKYVTLSPPVGSEVVIEQFFLNKCA
jgi:hypothetical protein